ncbi:hypothetical protein CUC15_09995 [Oceanobacillus zhaokaii]|uniref:Uncharacterized protein n=1 Tax=Oceanobacillus zhaokaii TaxID=2052660 RepID=A0A345PGW1_9BACI|nr:hypothetical protein [Oceanobacillus zhaokaii]AXI09241.1 hypothetical protein CUC15_09995 [Oceanobacillus zhaokaii]
MGNQNYSMELNIIKKEFKIEFRGSFSQQQTTNFLNDYNKHIGSITPSDYTLVLGKREMKVLTQEVGSILESAFELYENTGFKKVQIEISESPVVKMQLNRILKKTSLNAEFTEA